MIVTKLVTYETDAVGKMIKAVSNSIKIFNAIADDPEELCVDLKEVKNLLKIMDDAPAFTGDKTKRSKKKVSIKDTLKTETEPDKRIKIGEDVLPEDVAIMTAQMPYPAIKGKVTDFRATSK